MIDYIKFDSIISKYRAENRWREARSLDSKLLTITMQRKACRRSRIRG